MMRDAGFDTHRGDRPSAATDALGNALPRAAFADIGLLLEGTYPYVNGGVSSWVHDIIRAFPEYTFGLCFLGSKPDDYPKMAYMLPANVVHLENHYLYDGDPPPVQEHGVHGDREAFERIALLHEQLRRPADVPLDNRLVRRVVDDLTDDHRLGELHFLYSPDAWTFLTDQYRAHCSDPSFTDYFWSVRLMHRPLWQLARIAEQLIPMRLYHAISTGYAGFLGAMLRHRQGRPLLISEHGIYTKERKIELFQSQWIRDNRNRIEYDASHIGYFHEMWARFFESLGRMTYAAADDIVALYEGNRRRQMLDGAPAPKTRTIPNGVDLRRLAPLRAQRSDAIPKVLCLIGRVVPIKDVKTFIRAMLTVVRTMPEAEAWIAGPENEDPPYATECRELIDRLGLTEKVKLLGLQRIDELLPRIGVLVLSSISEALPLAVLEAFAAGVPFVTTTTIAEEMEISPGNLYYHFRNKDDIINSIFAQFEQAIEKRLRFPEDHRPTIDETWSYLQYMADFMWTYRFLYRDLNDLLARNRTLETHFKQIISHKVRFAREMCELLASDGDLVATPAEIEVIATNMAVISTYWLSYQYVMHPRKYNDQDAIREELHQVSMHVISVMAPYLRGRSRELFDDLVSGKLPKREFADYLPPRDGSPRAAGGPALAKDAKQ